ncbi:hypothetical protein B5180_01570 [Streptomyces sp. BF-3]|nr:hypothetical protein B5180_01570 [Streptomyces sp. BF-3]
MQTGPQWYDEAQYERVSIVDVHPGDNVYFPGFVDDEGQPWGWNQRVYVVNRVTEQAPQVYFVHRAPGSFPRPWWDMFVMVGGTRLTAGVLRLRRPAGEALCTTA